MAQPDFIWRDGERTVVFGAGTVATAPAALAERGWDHFELLTTSRALAGAPAELPHRAAAVHEVPAGPVNEAAAAVLGAVAAESLVALGGGRVIDAAKAIAAVRDGRVAALPTTLSGAEMTSIHRLPHGRDATRRVRPQLVLADPPAMTSLPGAALRASAMNALAHGADSLYTPLANPVSRLVALRGAELIASALDGPLDAGGREDLALGALLCAYAIDSSRLALHHVVSQTLVRVLRTPHAETNAAVLPRAMEAMRARAPEQIEALSRALRTDVEHIGTRLEELAGGRRGLGELGAEPELVDEAVTAMLARPDLQATPQAPGRDELRALVQAAW